MMESQQPEESLQPQPDPFFPTATAVPVAVASQPKGPRRLLMSQPQKRRPFQIALGLFIAAVVIGCAVIAIWLVTKPSSTSDEPVNPTTPKYDNESSTIHPPPPLPRSTTTGPPGPTTPAPSPTEKFITSRHLNLNTTSIVHVWLKAKQKDKEAVLYANLSHTDYLDRLASTRETGWFDFFSLELGREVNHVQFSWSNSTTEVTYLYAYEPETVKSEGIRPGHIAAYTIEDRGMDKSFHLRPPLGWINDPNGFSRSNDGLYHLFYQHNPHNRRWEAMHWGHAISADLVNWVHQPIFLRPEDKVCGNNCGWFSGSAVPSGDQGLQIYVTDHNTTRKPNEEMQVAVPSYDTVLPNLNGTTIVIAKPPENPRRDLNLTADFRDPNVFKGPGGFFYMTLGSKDLNGKGGVVLLYRTKEPRLESEWIYLDVLLTDNQFGTEAAECSGIVPLGDPMSTYTYYALIYARMSSQDGDGRENLTPIILGSFAGREFSRITEQELDFAAGSYGFQAFYDPIARETLVVGWLANWPDVRDPVHAKDFPSSMTLPRVLRRNGNTILIGPHPNVVQKLRGDPLDGKALFRGNIIPLPNGTAYIQLGLNYNYFYNGIFLRLNHPDYLQLGVRVTNIGMEIVKVKRGDKPNRRYMAANAQPDLLHIFIDRDSLEVFGEKKSDGGMPRWSGTTRLFGAKGEFVDSVQLQTTDRYNYVINECEIWAMKPAKMLGRMPQL